MHRFLEAPLAFAIGILILSAAELPAQVDESATQPPIAGSPTGTAALQHDPQFILEAVAKRMGVTLRPNLPPPTIQLESRTPLERLQVAAERQWGFRPEVFVTMYATAANEVYLIDEARLYDQYGGTLDDSLAHEFVHYIQVHYFGDRFDTDWSEVEAVAIQTWFRREYVATRLAAARSH